MLVEVRPLYHRKWHEKEGKESFTQPKGFDVLIDSDTGKYATGLTQEEAEKYGKILGVDLSDTYNPNEPHPYWGTTAARIKLRNQTMVFDDEKPSDFVKIKNMKASKFVANSMAEYNNGLWADAEFVIFDENDEVKLQASKVQLRNKCVKIATSLSNDEKVNIIQIIAEKSLRKRSQDFLDVELDKIINEKPAEFLKYAKMDKAEVYTRAAILECIHRNIMIKEATSIYYMGEKIANDYEEAVQWFLDPQNSKMKVAVLEKLNA